MAETAELSCATGSGAPTIATPWGSLNLICMCSLLLSILCKHTSYELSFQTSSASAFLCKILCIKMGIWYCRTVFWLGLVWTRVCQKRKTIYKIVADDVTNSGLQYCVFSLQKEKNPFVDERFITSSSSSYVPISLPEM